MAEPAQREARAPRPGSWTFPAHPTWVVCLGAALWVLSIAFFVDQLIAQAAFADHFDPARNMISDLGNTACGPAVCSPLHGFMNATFVVVGACHTLGAIATYRAWPARPVLRTVGLVALQVAGFGLIVAGLAPENESPVVHAVGALVGLVCLNLAMILLGSAIATPTRWLAAPTMAAGIAGLGGLVLFLGPGSGVPAGLAERVADYPSAAMIVVLGGYLVIAVARRATGTSPGGPLSRRRGRAGPTPT